MKKRPADVQVEQHSMLPPDLPNKKIDYWQAGKTANYSKSSEEEIFCAVGKALSSWEELKVRMAYLYALLIESPSLAALRAYGEYGGPRARGLALRAAAEVFFRRRKNIIQYYFDFDYIAHHYENAGHPRNNIAHGVVAAFCDKMHRTAGYYLIPPIYHRKRVSLYDENKRIVIGGSPVPLTYTYTQTIFMFSLKNPFVSALLLTYTAQR